MASAYYDINTQQNSTFNFHLEYYDDNGNPINLSEYTARFHVRPSTTSGSKYLEITTSGVTGGGTTGEWSGTTGGVSGSGRIYLNTGETGGVFTGGMLITADATTMGNVRVGSWKYSLDLTLGVTTEELMNGQFVVSPKVTR
jgi:hypothetical protein